MKKLLFFALCSVLAFTACEQAEIAGPDALDGNVITLKATHEGTAAASRTELSGSSVLWSAGDRIKLVWSGADAASEALASGGSSATFEVEIPDAVTPAYAVYPSTIDAAYDGSALTVTVPAEQTGGTFGGAAIELAEYNGGDLSFKHLCGLLKVTVPDHTPAVAKVVISAYGGKTIAGTATVAFSAGVPVVSSVTSPSSSVTLSVSGAGTYYAALLPADLQDGFYIELLDDSDNVIGQKLTGKQLDLKRRDVANLGSIAASAISGYFVKVTATGYGDGSSWDDAMGWDEFRTGIGSTGSLTGNIFMAGGTYTQTTTSGTSIRGSAVFSVYGGYDPESTGTDLSNRNTSTYETIFDGNSTCRLIVWNASGIETLFDGITFQNATYASAASGSALIIANGLSAKFNNCKINDNSNTSTDTKGGGGALRIAGVSCEFTGCTFSNNTANYCGGVAVINTGSKLCTMSKCVFENNSTGTTNSAGAIWHKGGTIELEDCTFDTNSSLNGGALVVGVDATLATLTRCTFTNNSSYNGSAYKEGGAIWQKGGTLVLEECSFENNTALRGSAIYANSSDYTLKANKCYFYHNNNSNKANSTGGAVWSDLTTGKMYLNACTFYQNYTGSYGSAIGNKGIACLNNCSFQENQNSKTSGAANYFTNNGKTLLASCTFRMSGASAVAVWAAGGKITMVNNVLVNSHGTASIDSEDGYSLKTGSESTAGSMIYSYGHNVCSKFQQVADKSGGDTYGLEDAGHPDALLYKLNQSYSGANRCALWSKWHDGWTDTDGAPSGFSLTTTTYISSVISAFDTANSTDFGTWLSSITTEGGTALNSDIRGKARSASTWPGCYDNGANVTL